ncbi:hypothetical protein D3C86_976750 [compost metagenome]
MLKVNPAGKAGEILQFVLAPPVFVTAIGVIVWLWYKLYVADAYEITGNWFTVRVKVVVAVAPNWSVTVSVIVAVPCWLAAGVTVTVLLAPVPPKTIFETGTRVVLEELLVTVRLAAAVSTSATVKARAVVAAFAHTA